jgi:hypothetical protein
VPAVAGFLVLLAALAISGCGAVDYESFRRPEAATIFRPLSVTVTRERTLPPVTAADLVDAEGRCASAAGPVSAEGPSAEQGAAAVISSGIAIDMTECEVVNRAGAPDQVAVGANERSERTATLTFLRGARPGIYHFTSGRLTSMERAPEPAPQQRPARPQRRASTPAPSLGR